MFSPLNAWFRIENRSVIEEIGPTFAGLEITKNFSPRIYMSERFQTCSQAYRQDIGLLEVIL